MNKIQHPCRRVYILQSENAISVNNTVSEMVQNNLLPEGTKFSIHVEEYIYYRVKMQSVCKNNVSEMAQNNLHPKGTASM